MHKLEIKPYYDIVIIGAGVGGLTAASILSKAGYTVCVLEKEPHVGGYLAGFRRKDFRFDTAIHWLNQLGPNGFVKKIFDFIGSDNPPAASQTKIKRYIGENYDYLLTNNPDQWRDQLIAEFPNEEKGLKKFFEAGKNLGKSMFNFGAVFRSEESMTFFEKLKNKKNLIQFALPFIPYIRFKGEKGLKKGLNKFFKDERIHRIFTAELEIIGCLIPIAWAYFGDYQTPPKGGGQVIPEWLKYTIEYFKNDIFGKCDVTEILLENNTSKGVAFSHRGNNYQVNSKYVIATNDVETLYEKMLPVNMVPNKMKQRLKNAELYSSSVTISIAVNCPVEQLGFGEEMIHLSCENIPFGQHDNGNPSTSELCILAPSKRDETLAPKGCGTITLFMPALMHYHNYWQVEKDENGKIIRGEAYKKLKTEIAEIIIKRIEDKIAPNLRQHILFYDVATPVTHWRYTGNKNGTMMGAKPGRKNMQNNIAHYQTPIKNLLLGGHWAELGGGVPIAVKAGSNAALLILKKENNPAFNSLAKYMDNKISLEKMKENNLFKPYNNSWVQPLTPTQKRNKNEA